MKAKLRHSDKMIGLIARRFRLLGEPFRLRILQSLERSEKTVGELVLELEGNQPNISRHLQLLYDAGILSRRRSGNSIFYSVADPMVIQLCDLVCQDAVHRMREDLQEIEGSAADRKPGRRD